MTETGPQDSLAITAATVEESKEISYPDLKSSTALFFIFILISVIVAIPGVILIMALSLLPHNPPLLKSLLNLLIYLATFLFVIKYTIHKSKEKQGYFNAIDFNKIQLWLIPVIIIGTIALYILLERTASWIPMSNSVRKFFEGAFTRDIFSIITLVVAAPVMEEILCRGIILRGLLKNYHPYIAILISALFFGLIHLNPWQAIPAFFGGLFLGWVYYKTKSVVPGMIIHATINSIAALLLFLPASRQDLLSLLGLPYYLAACVVAVLVFTAVCVIIHKSVVVVPEVVN